ncbi:nicotinate-nucleotide--dimethylbenzimidazole phosphoribosyltransferase [Schwartzia sp. (in: firmicutes)]
MSLLEDTLAKIQPPDGEAVEHIRTKLGRTIGDETGLGGLKDLLLKYAGTTLSDHPEPPKKCTIICCADHGVAAMKVSAYPPSTTVQMTENYLVSRGAVANALSNFAGSELLVADLGIAAPTEHLPGLIQKKIALGTANCAVGPAMTREQAVKALETGIELASSCAEKGVCCFLPGEMGIANTTSSACVAAAFCGLTPEEATGRGTNISDERLKLKISVVRQALEVNRPDPSDGLDVLMKVGGFEIGCMAGIILGAAANHAFVVIDGFNTGAAALIAHSLSPLTPYYLMGSHLAAEPAHKAMLKKLGITPYMDMKFRLGEATGSSIAVNLLDAAVTAYKALSEPLDISDFYDETMPPKAIPLTNKTFDFYLDTFPELSKEAMDACQLRIDNLAKPIYSLGYLEQIATELAGIMDDERPSLDTGRALLCFSTGEISRAQKQLTSAFAKHADAEVTIAHLREGRPLTDAFDFGRELAESLTFSVPILGVALTEASENDTVGSKAAALREALLNADGSLRYKASEFLQKTPKDLKTEVSALLGAIIAGAHNRAFIVLDDESTEIIARYAEALCPAVKPFILHTQPALLRLGMTITGGCIACLGIKIIDAALHMLNDMKTFAEARVSVANDGPGAGRQVE